MNTPMDLNSILFAQLDRLGNPNLNNPMDAFIANCGFDKAITQACESLPETVPQSLEEVS